MDYNFVNVCITSTKTKKIVYSSWGSFWEVFSEIEEVFFTFKAVCASHELRLILVKKILNASLPMNCEAIVKVGSNNLTNFWIQVVFVEIRRTLGSLYMLKNQ